VGLSLPLLAGLAAVGAAAGFVDAIAGGGGLLTLPALMLTGLPPHLALGTNKGQSVFGTAAALTRFAHSPLLDRRRAWIGAGPALAGSAIGVLTVQAIPASTLAPIVMALLAAVAVFFVVRRTPRGSGSAVTRGWLLTALVAFGLAFYDGFFGPGTGTFLIVVYTLAWRDPLDAASANAKVVNFCSNLAACVSFAAAGMTVWSLALPMGAGQLAGSWLGAHLTVRRGQPLVRGAVIVVSLALVARLAWQLARG
jgi:uncharacterized membrane protein YfcA